MIKSIAIIVLGVINIALMAQCASLRHACYQFKEANDGMQRAFEKECKNTEEATRIATEAIRDMKVYQQAVAEYQRHK